jgi:hypothetical protein
VLLCISFASQGAALLLDENQKVVDAAHKTDDYERFINFCAFIIALIISPVKQYSRMLA